MKTIIATVCNTKGGVGKTTLTANIAGVLSEIGEKVLLVDADNQPSLSSYYEIDSAGHSQGLTELVQAENPENLVLEELSHPLATYPNIRVIVSNDDKGHIKNWIMERPYALLSFRDNLRKAKHDFDIILIDTHGGSDHLQNAAVLAADFLISPVIPDLASAREFGRGTMDMIKSLEYLKPIAPLGPINIVINGVDNTNDAKTYVKLITDETFTNSFGSARVIKPMLSKIVAYKEATTQSISAHEMNNRTKSEMIRVVSDLFPHLADKALSILKEPEYVH